MVASGPVSTCGSTDAFRIHELEGAALGSVGTRPEGDELARPPEGLKRPADPLRGVKPLAAGEAHVGRLLRMLAGIEEAIIRLEAGGAGDVDRVISRLRLVQNDIATALKRLDDPGRS
jgi:hypothetical protein